jgi:hypothetical protein
MGYIGKHWRGELSLGVSFWRNFVFLHLVFLFLGIQFNQNFPNIHPVTYSQIAFVYNIFFTIILMPWQIVGVWRTCERGKEGVRTYWGRTVQILIVLAILPTLANITRDIPILKDLFHVGFEYKKDGFQDFNVRLATNNSFIHITGGLGFGVSAEFAENLAKHSGVRGVILDSRGGRLYEGREVAKIIKRKGLDTYSLRGCHSACAIAFIVGKNRYLGAEANLGFHQYAGLGTAEEQSWEQEMDLAFFRQAGVKERFIERMYIASKDNFWYPTINEMLEANVIHGIVKPSDIIPIASERNLPFPNKDNMTAEEMVSKTMGSFGKKLEDGDRVNADRKKAFIESQRIRFQPLLTLLEELVASFGREYIETKIWDSEEVNGYSVEGYYIAVGTYPFDILEEYAIEPGFFFKDNMEEALPIENGFLVTKFETDYNSGSQEHEFQEKTLFNSGTKIYEFQTKEEVINYLAEEIAKPIAKLRQASKNGGKTG